MGLRIIDNQTSGYFNGGHVFADKQEAREQLLLYHSLDHDVEDISMLTFEQILVYGDWSVEMEEDDEQT